MDIFEAIKTRRSIRHYEPNFKVPEKDLNQILEAGMYAPTAMRREPWEFMVITDQVILDKIEKNHPYAAFLSDAGTAIMVCEDMNLEYEGKGVIDVSLASQNIMLMAHALGYGTCYCGIYPGREETFAELLNLPPNIVVIGMIVLGKPIVMPGVKTRWRPERVHINKW